MAVQFPSKATADRLVVGFDWDEGNRAKCQKHGVSLVSVESLFYGPIAVFPDPAHSATEERFQAIGRSQDGRGVLIVFTLRRKGGEMLVRPISARYMHARELGQYEEAIAEAEQRQGS